MDSNSAVSVLTETRQHAALIAGQVGDFHAKLQELEQEAQSRFAEIQHDQQELLQHLQAERDRSVFSSDCGNTLNRYLFDQRTGCELPSLSGLP